MMRLLIEQAGFGIIEFRILRSGLNPTFFLIRHLQQTSLLPSLFLVNNELFIIKITPTNLFFYEAKNLNTQGGADKFTETPKTNPMTIELIGNELAD